MWQHLDFSKAKTRAERNKLWAISREQGNRLEAIYRQRELRQKNGLTRLLTTKAGHPEPKDNRYYSLHVFRDEKTGKLFGRGGCWPPAPLKFFAKADEFMLARLGSLAASSICNTLSEAGHPDLSVKVINRVAKSKMRLYSAKPKKKG